MLERIKTTYNEYNHNFWVLMGATFIDMVGNWMLFPFYALYLTSKFNTGLTEVGVLFMIFAISNIVGGFVGGALTDKYGRKKMFLFGLVTSATGNLILVTVNELEQFFLVSVLVGILNAANGPAGQAMIADLLPQDKLTDGYAIQRINLNVAAAIGPMIGGLLAGYSYSWLFIADAVTSYITAVIAYLVLPETKPKPKENKPEESLLENFKGYRQVAADKVFLWFIALGIFMNIVYFQLNTSLPVYLRDIHQVAPQFYGYLLTMNAIMVIILQFRVTKIFSSHPPFLVMGVGMFLYMIGFSIYGFFSATAMFVLAMVIITFGEMVAVPVFSAVVARIAPEDMRGRYMGASGLVWRVPFAVGPYMAGLVMDNYDPNWIWYGSGILSALTLIGYVTLHNKTQERLVEEHEPNLELEPEAA